VWWFWWRRRRSVPDWWFWWWIRIRVLTFLVWEKKKIREKFREKLEMNYDSRVIVFSFGYLVQKNKISGCKKLKKNRGIGEKN
jgi:hypothetical protein